MKALTICQPYATMIMQGTKRVENRTWETKYRGRFYLHAGKSRDFLKSTRIDGVDYCPYTELPLARLPMGAVLGIATLLDCVKLEDVKAGKYDAAHPWLRDHPHTEGPWCWVLGENIVRIDPTPWKGAQGLFDINPLTLERAEAVAKLRKESA